MRHKIKALLLAGIFLSSTAFAAEQVYFFHTDPAGTPLAMTDSSGAVVWKADYKPFGEENTITSTQDNNKKFVGKEKDEETGLYYFGARYMEAKIGRFTAVDPIGAVDPLTSTANEALLSNPQRLNLYAYGLNNPYKFVDPDGLSPQDRVDWAISQLSPENRAKWKYWSSWSNLPYNKCNLFVAGAHVVGDPDVYGYPTVLKNPGTRGPDSIYSIPVVEDLADPLFARDRLDYLADIKKAEPGDIIVWFNKKKNVHHSAIHIGNGQVVYAEGTVGAKQRAIEEVTKSYKVEPIVRRYKYE